MRRNVNSGYKVAVGVRNWIELSLPRSTRKAYKSDQAPRRRVFFYAVANHQFDAWGDWILFQGKKRRATREISENFNGGRQGALPPDIRFRGRNPSTYSSTLGSAAKMIIVLLLAREDACSE